MKIANILFNHSKSSSDNHVLGVERCFIDYSKLLIDYKNEVLAITKSNMVFADEVRQTGAKFLAVPALSQGDIFSILRIAVSLFFFRPDVAICHSGRALFFARMARIFCLKKFPIIGIDHGVNPKKFLKADYVLTVNSFFSKELVKAGKAPDRALVIPNMIKVPQNFAPLVKKAFRHPIKLGALGRLYPEKNFDKILRAMAVLKKRGIESELVIGGIGPQEAPLNALASQLGLEKNFKILGWTSDKHEFFDSIDIFLLPSWGETFGIVLLEAMLYSTPIITSNSWGPDEIIEDGVDGLKVAREDHEAMPTLLADAIERLVNDEEFARKLAKKAEEKFYTKYSSEVVSKRLYEICLMVARKGL